MTAILLDTHVLIALMEGDGRLGDKARKAIEAAHAESSLFVSAISFWEMGMWIAKEKLSLVRPLAQWRADVITMGIQEIALSGDIAVLATELDWAHSDAADRVIAASAIVRAATLLTSDEQILGWKSRIKRLDAAI